MGPIFKKGYEMRPKKAMTDADYTTIGRRYGSNDVFREAQEASAKWLRDISVLKDYGFGQEDMDEFNNLRNEHHQLIEKRSIAVSEKKVTTKTKHAVINEAWTWTAKVDSILGRLARKDNQFSIKLQTTLPSEDPDLYGAVPALANLLRENADRLPPDSGVQNRLSEVEAVMQKLGTIYGEAATTRTKTTEDTLEIDHKDGVLYIKMRDLYEAGRRAIRAGELNVPSTDYRFQFLVNRKQTPTDPAPEPQQ